MLNISDNSVSDQLPAEFEPAVNRHDLPRAHRLMKIWLFTLTVVGIVLLFMPWTQNIQAKGKVTTLQPEHRPQTIHATISGRIEQWYVREGQRVSRGDTIAFLSEVKTEYFAPDLVDRAADQVRAKEDAISAYRGKASALADQIGALDREFVLKQEQLEEKVEQVRLKLESMRAEAEQARVALQIAERQLARTDTLLERGIKSQRDLEESLRKYQEARAKAVAADNKVGETARELDVAQLELRNLSNDYQAKLSKARSDRFATLSDQFTAEGEYNKSRVELQNYSRRSDFYYITAPQDAYITEVMQPGLGEIIKEGEPLVSIMPANFELAVAMYIPPSDLPLISIGQNVRFLFDGWPAIVFSGWPGMTYGAFTGEVVAIDNITNKDGMYRVLVAPDDEARPWPAALRPGSGARGIALLNTVPLWYEVWRQLNAFPPDFYVEEEADSAESPKMKAPLKSVK